MTDEPNFRPIFSTTPDLPAVADNGKPRYLDCGESEMVDDVFRAKIRAMGLHESHSIVADLVNDWSPGGKFGISDIYPRHRAAFLRRLEWLKRQAARAHVAPVSEPVVQAPVAPEPSTDLSDLIGDGDTMNAGNPANDANSEQPTTPFLVASAPKRKRSGGQEAPFTVPNPGK